MNIVKNTICLWYDNDAETAARFYADTFPDSSIDAINLAPGDYPSGKEGDVITVEFTVMGVACIGLNGILVFSIMKHFHFRWRLKTRRKQIATGMPLWAMAVRKVSVAGARTSGAFPGRLRQRS